MTKEIIRNKAISLFLEKGYNNVTVNDICNACSITKPTFYNYISSKENLIMTIYDDIIEDLLSNIYGLFDLESSYEQLIAVFSMLISQTKQYGSDLFGQLLIVNLKDNKKSFDLRDNLTQLCLSLIKNAQIRNEIHNKENPKRLYYSIAYMFTGYETMWCIHDGNTEFEEEFFESMETVLLTDKKYQGVYKKYV